MAFPDEYESWRCEDCKQGEPGGPEWCRPSWQECADCNGKDENCESCCGSGGGHICLNEVNQKPAGQDKGNEQ